MPIKDRWSQYASDFLWNCIAFVAVAVILWFFGSFFFSVAALLFVALIALAPLLCLLVVIFVLYFIVRSLIDYLRG
jgi:hypothetical protein